ncbi:MAG: CGGC domain-containing protein [Phascolarctobacterium sp.]|nr:CGGC domain-containing protein [Phascolarctobacterium sp.]
MSKLVVIVQCDIVCQRCPGFPCMNAFYNREGAFKDYDEDTRYLSFTCGGCCGMGLAAKLENLIHKLNRNHIPKENVVVHLASCVVSDNYHNPPCPHREYLKEIVQRKGFELKLGSYLSKRTQERREAGLYKEWDE